MMRVGALALLAALCPGAHAGYKARPFFQAPYQCGETWRATSYDGHQNNLDLNQWNGADSKTIQDEGNLVRAAASGRVVDAKVVNDPDSKHHGAVRLWLNHENDWQTYYTHLIESVNFMKGEFVAQGEVLGRTGTTGNSNGPHIHISQKAINDVDGKYDNLRHRYNGELTSVHEGAFDKKDYIMSSNCAGEEFMSWSVAGKDFMMTYKPTTGAMKILQVASDGKGTQTKYSRNWSLQWTNMAAFKLDGVPHAILYKARTGRVAFIRLHSDGTGYTDLSGGTWGAGWTHIVPFTSSGKVYLLVYNSLTGSANWERVHANGSGTTNLSKQQWIRGRTQIVPFHRGVQYMLLYRGGSGQAKIFQVDFTNNAVQTTHKYTGTWATGWTHMVDYNDGFQSSNSRLFMYNQETGKMQIVRYNSGGNGVTTTYTANWTKAWTHFTRFYIGSKGHVLMYKTHSGRVETYRLMLSGVSKVWGSTWTTGHS